MAVELRLRDAADARSGEEGRAADETAAAAVRERRRRARRVLTRVDQHGAVDGDVSSRADRGLADGRRGDGCAGEPAAQARDEADAHDIRVRVRVVRRARADGERVRARDVAVEPGVRAAAVDRLRLHDGDRDRERCSEAVRLRNGVVGRGRRNEDVHAGRVDRGRGADDRVRRRVAADLRVGRCAGAGEEAADRDDVRLGRRRVVRRRRDPDRSAVGDVAVELGERCAVDLRRRLVDGDRAEQAAGGRIGRRLRRVGGGRGDGDVVLHARRRAGLRGDVRLAVDRGERAGAGEGDPAETERVRRRSGVVRPVGLHRQRAAGVDAAVDLGEHGSVDVRLGGDDRAADRPEGRGVDGRVRRVRRVLAGVDGDGAGDVDVGVRPDHRGVVRGGGDLRDAVTAGAAAEQTDRVDVRVAGRAVRRPRPDGERRGRDDEEQAAPGCRRRSPRSSRRRRARSGSSPRR